ncbi:MAG: PaaI family thioesterase [Alphaproteobacteria bacterium]|nr:PaaI family thioesterase [Alphaproteobacteria bacterium]
MTAPAIDAATVAQITQAVPQVRALGITVVKVDVGVAVLRLTWRADLVGDPASGVLHGGIVTTMLDTASGMAVLAAVREVMQIATLDLRIDYLRPAEPRLAVLAEATCYKMTRSIAFVRGRAFQEGGPDIAASLATFMLQSSALPRADRRQPSAP